MKTFTLFEVNEFMRRIIALNYTETIWISAEIAQINFSRGHAYLELIEKQTDGGEIIAQLAAVIWHSDLRRILKLLGEHSDGILQNGMDVRLKARMDFHERYGLKLIIEEVDATYTLGKLELERRKTLLQLQQLELIDKNKRLTTPLVWQRLAVISSETAAGWADFQAQLTQSQFQYTFEIQFFNAAMQGQNLVKELIECFDRIFRVKENFDGVIIIRGGGAKLDLGGFDSFDVARAIATFPLPVLTGIGHETDATIADIVAHRSLKTPTAVAEYLLQHNLTFETRIFNLAQQVVSESNELLHQQYLQLQRFSDVVQLKPKDNLKTARQWLRFIEIQTQEAAKQVLKQEKQKLKNADSLLKLLDDAATLRRGFSITKRTNGAPLTEMPQNGETVTTILANGTFVSRVEF